MKYWMTACIHRQSASVFFPEQIVTKGMLIAMPVNFILAICLQKGTIFNKISYLHTHVPNYNLIS